MSERARERERDREQEKERSRERRRGREQHVWPKKQIVKIFKTDETFSKYNFVG